MDPIARMVAAGAAGAAGGSSATYVDDVFSTYLYNGTGSAKTITNGIDLSGEGGLVWIKQRDESRNHSLYDTERGVLRQLVPNANLAQGGASGNDLDAFNSDGFSLGTDTFSIVNKSGGEYASWSFRKAPGFLDIVTYAGTGSAHSISHSLGSEPGMIWYKPIDDTREWMVYHRSLGASQRLILNENYAAFSSSDFGSGPTSTHFSVGNTAVNNTAGKNYIAYIFAHDDQSFGTNSDESIIKCGSYTGAANTVNTVELGFEPQWLMIKNTSRATDSYGSADWWVGDIMREMSHQNARALRANTTDIEYNGGKVYPTSTGFVVDTEDNIDHSTQGDTYIYMAIRRPNKPATAATDVFTADDHQTGNLTPYFKTGGHVSDFVVFLWPTANFDAYFTSRLTGKLFMITSQETTEQANDFFHWYYMDGMNSYTSSGDQGYNHLSFKRSPGFCDVVTYTGNGSNGRTVKHNLEAVPELMFVTGRNYSGVWAVYSSVTGNGNYLRLNTDSESFSTNFWYTTTPTSTEFTLNSNNNVNGSYNYIAYLFASLDGISKIGSYTGTGGNINVDCGFTAGARFVMIKRADSTGDWYIWDTARGINSGAPEPYMRLNETGQEVSGSDYIDPLNAGFTVTSSAPSALNTNGGTYLFFAIA